MNRAEYTAKTMTENTGVIWKPLQAENVENCYLISENGDIFNYKLHCLIAATSYQAANGLRKYVRLRAGDKQRSFQVDELMLQAFPERMQDALQWRTVHLNGEPTAYEVSENGDVRRINNHHIVKPAVHKCGYFVIRFRHNGKTITEYAHRLVAMEFIPNPNGYNIVNHKDENRHNNAVSNLEWCDKQYNMLYNGAAKRAGTHALLTKKLRALANAGNQLADEILQCRNYYDLPDLLGKAHAITGE